MEFRVPEKVQRDRGHQRIKGRSLQLRLDRLLLDRSALQVEVEVRLVRADATPGDRIGHRGTEQVQAGVKAHVAMTTMPISP